MHVTSDARDLQSFATPVTIPTTPTTTHPMRSTALVVRVGQETEERANIF